MKRAFSFLAALVLLIAAGCEKQSPNSATPPPLPTSFSANLSADFCGTEMKAKLTQKSNEEYIIEMLSPDIMTPLKLTYNRGVCTVNYDGLEFESDSGRFPQSEFGALLTQALSYIGQNIDIQKTYDGTSWTYKGIGSRGEFSIKQNAENGEWINFNVQSADLTVIFSDFSLI